MKRLTKEERMECHHDKNDCNDNCMYGWCKWLKRAIKRLWEYENTGLTPDQIREIDKLYTEKCKELAELKEKDRWIPVDEKMPECTRHVHGGVYASVNVEVTCQTNTGELYSSVDFVFGTGKWACYGSDEKVIAWKPLSSEPYRENKCSKCFGAANNDCERCEESWKAAVMNHFTKVE